MGRRSQSTITFCINLEKYFKCPILLWDERLSTKAIEKEMIKSDTTRKKRAKTIDTSSATWILQGAMDAMQNINSLKINKYNEPIE